MNVRRSLEPRLVSRQTAWTFALNTESTCDWKAEQWSVPVNFIVNKVLQIGGQPVSVSAGVATGRKPDSGPEGFGGRLVFTLPFPR